MYHDVKRRFEEEITKRLSSKPEVLKYVLRFERKEVCLRNLCEQIEKLERASFQIVFDAKKYDTVIRDVANLYMKAVVHYLSESMMTDAAKAKQRADANYLKDAQELADELEKEAFRGADESEKADLERIKAAREKERIDAEIEAERADRRE